MAGDLYCIDLRLRLDVLNKLQGDGQQRIRVTQRKKVLVMISPWASQPFQVTGLHLSLRPDR